ncbi:MAG: TIGR01777 family oxidoreductase [Parachlamydiaceae bacterium]
MKILIAGSSGLIGTALCQALAASDIEVYRLKRHMPIYDPKVILWDPSQHTIDVKAIEGFDVIINLAGESVFGRWTSKKKNSILESRISSTSLLANTIASLKYPPEVFINASAIGYYGNRDNEILTESSSQGNDFLANVCKQWEEATQIVQEKGIRTIQLRIGVVLSQNGGALKTMLTPFKLGLGGKLGSGMQYMSWIAINDVIGAILHLIQHKQCQGPFNLTADKPVTNAVFTSTLGKVLHRPTFFSQPKWVIKLMFGEMGDALLLGSTRAKPKKLLENGYQFIYSKLEEALQHLLSAPA